MTGDALRYLHTTVEAKGTRDFSLAPIVLAVVLTGMGMVACIPLLNAGQPSLESYIQARFIPAPADAEFVQVAWPPETPGPVVWLQHDAGPQAFGPVDDPLYVLNPDTGALAPLPLPNDPTCKGTGHHVPRMLPDGRLGYIQFCFGHASPQHVKKLMAYDFTKRIAAPLEPYFLDFGAKDYDFRPDMRVGIINDGNGLYERLDWLLPDRQVDIGLPFARSGQPSWSPDGTFIAVDAAPNDLGRTGQDRGTLPRNLYLLTSDGKVSRVLLNNIGELLGAPLWSPDSRWLIASINFPDGETGLWLINVQTAKVFHLFAGEDLSSPVWSPDHQSIAAPIGVAFPGDASPKIGIYILHVGNLDQLASRVAR